MPPKEIEGVHKNVLLPPGPNNPRNSEGDFIELNDGRLLFIYTHFAGGGAGDHEPAYLASRFSEDRGATWSDEDELVVDREGDMNVMSVSLLRFDDGRIALFYLRKNSLDDIRPLMRISEDEAETWSEPVEVITDEIAGYVVNNDRVIQTSSGRIVVPAALHQDEDGSFLYRGRALCYLSDDRGETWRRSRTVLDVGDPADTTGLQEPGVVELKDGRLMMFNRTDRGSQYVSYSDDEGETWSPVEPSNIISPRSPASMKRIPSTGDLLLVWNDHSNLDPSLTGRRRTPFAIAISSDEGETWTHRKNLEDHPEGWYCYTAIAFVDDHVLLGHVAGRRATEGRLATTQITRFAVEWLYR